MKIGILTFHKPINYGAFLQSFSLSKKIALSFPNDSVEIVNYIAPKENKKIYLNVLRTIKYFGVKNGIKDIAKIKSFHSVYPSLVLSKKLTGTNLSELYGFIDENYDVLIIGSDAVFNWNQNGYPTAFIPQYSFKHCKIVTYAASVHGLRYLEEPQSRLTECGQTFRKMMLIGVRDNNTANFVRACDEQEKIIHCCDPTIVIDIEEITKLAGDYKTRIKNKFKCDLNKKFIVFMLPDSDLTERIKARYSDEYQLITLFKPSKCTDYYLYDLNPFEWAAVLSQASLIVTSYFHGTLLGLKHNTPVIAVDYSDYNDENYEGKLKDLLFTRFNLPELYCDSRTLDNTEIQNNFINTMDEALQGKFESRMKNALKCESTAFDAFLKAFQSVVLK